MSAKKQILLLVIAVVVCLAVFFSERGGGNKSDEPASIAPVADIKAFKGVKADTVERIEVTPPGKTEPITLEKKDKVWNVRVGDQLYRVDKTKADRLFSDYGDKVELGGELTLEFQAKNPENHAMFDLTADKATRVKFFGAGGKLLEDMLIGKNGQDWQSTFVRRPDKPEVYLADVRLNDNFVGTETAAWRVKKLFPDVETAKVGAIEVDDRVNTRTYALERRLLPSDADPNSPRANQGNWWVVRPFEEAARPYMGESLARSVADISAVEFPAPGDVPKNAFDRLSAIIRFGSRDNPSSCVLTLSSDIPGKDRRLYAKTNLSDEIYIVTKPYDPFRAPEDFKETPTPTPSPTPADSPTTEGGGQEEPSAAAPASEKPAADNTAPIGQIAIPPIASPVPTPKPPAPPAAAATTVPAK